MKEINDLLEKRRESLRRDHENGWLSRPEYIAVKAELIAIQLNVDELAARAANREPVEGEQC